MTFQAPRTTEHAWPVDWLKGFTDRGGVLKAENRVLAGILRAGDHLPGPMRRTAQRLANSALMRADVPIAGRSRYGFALCGSSSDLIARYVAVYGVWEPDISAWSTTYLREGDVVIDVGANLGYFSLLCSRLVGPAGRVVAIEAAPSTFARLESNLSLNRATNVDARTGIAASAQGIGRIYVPVSDTAGNATTIPTEGMALGGVVPQIVIDEIMHGCAPRLVKIDTEGDEVSVLRGMPATLAAMHPGAAVLVEVTPHMLARRGHSARELFDLLDAFDAFVLENDYSPSRYARQQTNSPRPIHQVPTVTQDVLFIKR